ncbi:MAG: phosphotransferase [Actinomycetes bacterium]
MTAVRSVAGERVALHALAADRARAWFPELVGHRVDVTLSTLGSRPRANLLLLEIGDGGLQRRAVVKIRRDPAESAANRPGLVPHVLPADQQAALEFAGLRGIAAAVDPADSRFGVVRALDHLPEMAAVVLEHVDQPTARRALLAAARLGRLSPRRSLRPAVPAVFRHAGAWLRGFHATTDTYRLESRQETTAELVPLVADYATFLAGQVGARRTADLATEAAQAIAATLPARLPTAVGHGDFAVRNLFVDATGRVSVFDPLPRWRAPLHEDLARFLVSVRLLGLQVHSRGAAYSRGWLDARESDFVSGYYGADPAPRGELHAFQLLLLLDKWSAVVSQRGTSHRGRLRAPAGWVDGYVHGEARRLLAALEAAT